MGYRYLEDFAIADVAFEATGSDLEGLFEAAADAAMNVMIGNIDAIEPQEKRIIDLAEKQIDLLLFDFLQELIYHKDAERLLLRIKDISISYEDGTYAVHAIGRGETLDPERHEQCADVKAVTLHHFRVEQTESGWSALVILDV
jgi:SHS2 domain-containing protein